MKIKEKFPSAPVLLKLFLLGVFVIFLTGCAANSVEERVEVDQTLRSSNRPDKKSIPDIPPKPWEDCGEKITPTLREHLLTNDEPYFMISITFAENVDDGDLKMLEKKGVLVTTHSGNKVTARGFEEAIPELCDEKEIRVIDLSRRLEGGY